jgi:hypothetical protein
MAGDFAIVTLVISLSSIATGLLSEAVGVRVAMTVGAGAAGVAGVLYLVLTAGLRRA